MSNIKIDGNNMIASGVYDAIQSSSQESINSILSNRMMRGSIINGNGDSITINFGSRCIVFGAAGGSRSFICMAYSSGVCNMIVNDSNIVATCSGTTLTLKNNLSSSGFRVIIFHD